MASWKRYKQMRRDARKLEELAYELEKIGVAVEVLVLIKEKVSALRRKSRGQPPREVDAK